MAEVFSGSSSLGRRGCGEELALTKSSSLRLDDDDERVEGIIEQEHLDLVRDKQQRISGTGQEDILFARKGVLLCLSRSLSCTVK